MTAPTLRLPHVALVAHTSAVVIAASCTVGLDKGEVPPVHV